MLRTGYRQVLPKAVAELYRSNRISGGFLPTTTQGFMTRIQDSLEESDPQRIWDLLRPDHPGADGVPSAPEPDGSVYVLEFDVEDEANVLIGLSTSGQGGRIHESRFVAPWTGYGSSDSDLGWVREYVSLYPLQLVPGARIMRFLPGREPRVWARLVADNHGRAYWVDQEGRRYRSADPTVALHTQFVDVDGMYPALSVNKDFVAVTAPDSRAVRARIPGVQVTGCDTEGAWGFMHRFQARRVWIRTVAKYAGLPVTIQTRRQGLRGEIFAGITYVGRPFPGMEESGFWGNQYTGFHAEVPWKSLERVQKMTTAVDADPSRVERNAPQVEIDPSSESWGSDYVVIGEGRPLRAAISRTGRITVEAPDIRAASEMYPGHGAISVVSPTRTLVDITDLVTMQYYAVTQGWLLDGPVNLVGRRGHRVLRLSLMGGSPIPLDPTQLIQVDELMVRMWEVPSHSEEDGDEQPALDSGPQSSEEADGPDGDQRPRKLTAVPDYPAGRAPAANSSSPPDGSSQSTGSHSEAVSADVATEAGPAKDLSTPGRSPVSDAVPDSASKAGNSEAASTSSNSDAENSEATVPGTHESTSAAGSNSSGDHRGSGAVGASSSRHVSRSSAATAASSGSPTDSPSGAGSIGDSAKERQRRSRAVAAAFLWRNENKKSSADKSSHDRTTANRWLRDGSEIPAGYLPGNFFHRPVSGISVPSGTRDKSTIATNTGASKVDATASEQADPPLSQGNPPKMGPDQRSQAG